MRHIDHYDIISIYNLAEWLWHSSLPATEDVYKVNGLHPQLSTIIHIHSDSYQHSKSLQSTLKKLIQSYLQPSSTSIIHLLQQQRLNANMLSNVISLALLALPALSIPITQIDSTNSDQSLAPRQYSFPDVSANCPHLTIAGPSKGPAHHHWQVTDNMSCGGANGCGTSKLQSHTFGVDSSISITKIIGLTAGITESWTSGETYTCDGVKGDTVCVWVDVAYSIFDMKTASGCSDHSLVEAKIPNADNNGGGYYCVTGSACRALDQNYWA